MARCVALGYTKGPLVPPGAQLLTVARRSLPSLHAPALASPIACRLPLVARREVGRAVGGHERNGRAPTHTRFATAVAEQPIAVRRQVHAPAVGAREREATRAQAPA